MSKCREHRRDCIDDKKCIISNAINGLQKTLNSCCCCVIRKLEELINEQSSAFCIANSVCEAAEEGDAEIAVILPANSCITEIFVSGRSADDFDSILITVNNGTENIFCQRFYVAEDAGVAGVNFETALTRPLCVGAGGATVTATIEGGTADEGLLTVVYCESCCSAEE